jgi:hypothetical protein
MGVAGIARSMCEWREGGRGQSLPHYGRRGRRKDRKGKGGNTNRIKLEQNNNVKSFSDGNG